MAKRTRKADRSPPSNGTAPLPALVEPVTPYASNGMSVQFNALAAMQTTMMQRVLTQGRYGLQFEGRRDLVTTFGYLAHPSFQDFWAYSLRGLGSRIVELYPRETWAIYPTVQETDEPGEHTPFEQDIVALQQRLDIWGAFKDLDLLAQIGEYGVLLMGVDGVSNLETPLSGQTRQGGPDSLLFLRPYRQDRADIIAFEQDKTSPRYGLPTGYRLETRLISTTQGGQLTDQFNAHYSHVLHFADNTRENRVLGQPILLKVLDQLFDLMKMSGGIGEMTYRDGKRRVVTELREGYDVIEEATKKQIEAFAHDFKDFLAVSGTDVKSIHGEIPNISDNIKRSMELIAGILDVPMRQLFGSEQGQLATELDVRSWNNKKLARFSNICVPRIIRPFIDWALEHGIVRPPAGGEYRVIPPDFLAISAAEQSEVDKRNTESLRVYVGPAGDPEMLLTREEFRTLALSTWNLAPEPAGGFPEDEDVDEDEAGAGAGGEGED